MDPYDAPGVAIQGRYAEISGRSRSDRPREEPARTVIVFGQPPIPQPVQSERTCRDSDALIAARGVALERRPRVRHGMSACAVGGRG